MGVDGNILSWAGVGVTLKGFCRNDSEQTNQFTTRTSGTLHSAFLFLSDSGRPLTLWSFLQAFCSSYELQK